MLCHYRNTKKISNITIPNVKCLELSIIYIFVPKRNTGFVLSFYMPASKRRPIYSSVDTSNTNTRPLVTILWCFRHLEYSNPSTISDSRD